MKREIKIFLEKCNGLKQNIFLWKNTFFHKYADSRKRIGLRRTVATAAVIGFLGLLYPELCITEDTCRVVYVTEDGREEVVSVKEGSELYYQLLSAEPEEIKIKSRLLEWLGSIW